MKAVKEAAKAVWTSPRVRREAIIFVRIVVAVLAAKYGVKIPGAV